MDVGRRSGLCDCGFDRASHRAVACDEIRCFFCQLRHRICGEPLDALAPYEAAQCDHDQARGVEVESPDQLDSGIRAGRPFKVRNVDAGVDHEDLARLEPCSRAAAAVAALIATTRSAQRNVARIQR